MKVGLRSISELPPIIPLPWSDQIIPTKMNRIPTKRVLLLLMGICLGINDCHNLLEFAGMEIEAQEEAFLLEHKKESIP